VQRFRQRTTIGMHLLLLMSCVAACAPGGVARSGVPQSVTGEINTPTPEPSGSPGARVPLPADFPVLPGARPAAVPNDDHSVIARWTSDEAGAVAYDFYVDALPDAGYPTTGLYPGGAVAIIRFEGPGAATWQLLLTREGEGTRIDVRLDQP
jgi:hypothetical protein